MKTSSGYMTSVARRSGWSLAARPNSNTRHAVTVSKARHFLKSFASSSLRSSMRVPALGARKHSSMELGRRREGEGGGKGLGQPCAAVIADRTDGGELSRFLSDCDGELETHFGEGRVAALHPGMRFKGLRTEFGTVPGSSGLPHFRVAGTTTQGIQFQNHRKFPRPLPGFRMPEGLGACVRSLPAVYRARMPHAPFPR